MEKEARDQFTVSAVITYPRDAVLIVEQVALGLQCSVSAVERADFPSHSVSVSGRLVRFIWGEVLDALAKR